MTRSTAVSSTARVLIIVVLGTVLLAPVNTCATAQGATPEQIPVRDVGTETTIDFPRGIRFSTDLGALVPDASARVELHYMVAGNETEHLVFVPASARSGNHGQAIALLVDLQSNFVPSGVMLDFYWEVLSDSDEIGRTTPDQVEWFDSRWRWTTERSDQVIVHSYGLASVFVSTIVDSAQSTVSSLEDRYLLERSRPIDIWLYPSIDDFRGSQQPNSREAVAGASYPGFFLIVAVIGDGDTREVGRVIPHEVSHQVLFQATKNPFTLAPLWFDEGLATHYQISGTDGYMDMVIAARKQNRLFHLDSLDTTFPFLPAQATLAYAASWSAIEFIEQQFGDEGVERLIAAFASGEPFDTAIQDALGMSLTELDGQWRLWIDRQALRAAAGSGGAAARLPLAA